MAAVVSREKHDLLRARAQHLRNIVERAHCQMVFHQHTMGDGKTRYSVDARTLRELEHAMMEMAGI